MKIKTLLLAVLASVFLAACGDGSDEEMNHEAPESDEMRTLDVELFTPDHIMAGDTVEMTVHVTSNEEDVTEADHVMLEIKDENEETVEEITDEHSENGEYTDEYKFDEAGTYTVISHCDELTYQSNTRY